ncbi:MAG: type II toxin-antitoxin system VapC family toxin [Proteobacteria bacterium]|nr:type II toxin-antitoxin system VapC family toxin [Pseudomonadota bacterium]
MRLLLDTCILYDWMMGEITDASAIGLIQTYGATASTVSIWEMVIKHGLGKLDLPSKQIVDDVEAQGFIMLNIAPQHTQTVFVLENHHKDPYDRLLIAQAKHESMRIITYDAMFRRYLTNTFIVKNSGFKN